MMREPYTLDVKPVGEDKKHARYLLWSGLTILAAGIIILLAPEALNWILAVLIVLFGLLQLLIIRWQGPLFNQTTGWLTIGFGLLVFLFPQMLNYLIIIAFIGLTLLFTFLLLAVNASLWTGVLLVLALVGGLMMWMFPLSLNIVFAVYLVVAGVEQLLMSWRTYYRWQWQGR